MTDVVTVRNLQKTYSETRFLRKKKYIHALKGISFSVKEGEIFGILGPNGAGKSTLMNILADLLTHDEGEIIIFGKDFFKNKGEIKMNMSLINGYASAPHKLTIYENMKVNAKIYGVKDYESRIDHLLELVDLTKLKHRRFSQLSTGQRTRVNIMKGLLHRPKLILMDEPTIGLDPHIAKRIRKLILDINREDKVTILFTSHYMKEVEEICHRIALLKEGEILRIAPLHDLLKLIDLHTHNLRFTGAQLVVKKILEKFNTKEIHVEKGKAVYKTPTKFKLEKLLLEFIKNGIHVSHLDIQRPTLEEIFIEIAEGRL